MAKQGIYLYCTYYKRQYLLLITYSGLTHRRSAINVCWMISERFWVCSWFSVHVFNVLCEWRTGCSQGPVHIHVLAAPEQLSDGVLRFVFLATRWITFLFPFRFKIFNSRQMLPDIFSQQSSRPSNSCDVALSKMFPCKAISQHLNWHRWGRIPQIIHLLGCGRARILSQD